MRSTRAPAPGPPGAPARLMQEARPLSGRLLTQTGGSGWSAAARTPSSGRAGPGRFPHARLADGRWTVPSDDLVAAGLCTEACPERIRRPASCAASAVPASQAEPATVELARAEARIAGLEEVVARQDDELRFLRLAVDTLAKRGAA